MKNLSIAILVLATFVYTEGLLLQGGQLRADQEPEAWWDEDSKQWFIRLTCGSFSFVGTPPLNVTWTTPKGESRFSSGYQNGRFYLKLDSPLQGGNYTCAIPAHHLLIIGEGEGNPDQGNGSAVVSVDEVKSRLTLLEAHQRTLQEMLVDLEQMHHRDMSNLTAFCGGIRDTVEEHQVQIEELQAAMGGNQPADLSGPCANGQYKTLNDSWRAVDNKLGDYEDYNCDRDLDDGWYRFFLHGEDAVIPTHCVEDHHCQTHAPQWVDLQGQDLPGVGQEVSVRACANWDDDCCNWESPITVRNCGPFFVYRLQPRDTCHLAYCSEPKN